MDAKISQLKFGCTECDWTRTIHLFEATPQEEMEVGEALLARHFQTHGMDFDKMRKQTFQPPTHES